jgi:hypothetical protein
MTATTVWTLDTLPEMPDALLVSIYRTAIFQGTKHPGASRVLREACEKEFEARNLDPEELRGYNGYVRPQNDGN